MLVSDPEGKFEALRPSALPEFYADREQLIDLPYVDCAEGADTPGIVSPCHSMPTHASPARIMRPEAEAPGRLLRARGFDTELVTGRPPAPHFHSWMHYAWQAQAMWPDLYVHIHP